METNWLLFSESFPNVNRKIMIDLGGDIFESDCKIMANLNNIDVPMVNIVQENGSDFYVGKGFVDGFKWCYKD